MIVWDENDYSGSPTQSSGLFPPQNQNKVVLTVESNYDGDDAAVQSGKYYNSFSLLRSLEAGFGLLCLNHACDTLYYAHAPSAATGKISPASDREGILQDPPHDSAFRYPDAP